MATTSQPTLASRAAVRLTRLSVEPRSANRHCINHEISERGNRWWEFYAVRYAMGSITGAVIFFTLCTNTASLKPLLFDFNYVSWEILLLLGLYGMTFCYIASAPILVMHASRMFIGNNPNKGKEILTPCKRILLLLFAVLILPGLVIYIASDLKNLSKIALFFAVLPASIVLVLQFYYAGLALAKPKIVYEFYKKLAEKRAKKTDIIESYRHLREHGNAFGIVFCEIILAIVLYVGAALIGQNYANDSVIAMVIITIMLWTFPAALVWLSATLIEQNFTNE